MTNTEEVEEELRKTRYPRLRVLTGGKGPPKPPEDSGPNWLAEYEVGTTFVARAKNSKEVDLNLYHVLFKDLPNVMLLKWQLPDGKLLDYYVDPERFSKQFEKPTILGVSKQETSEEDDNGIKPPTDQSPEKILQNSSSPREVEED